MITTQVESFISALPELRELFPHHHQELGLFQDRMPLRPQYNEYVERERSGRLFLVTVRRDGRIVAYYTAQVTPGFHYGETLTGTMDLCYVTPDERGRGLILPLMRCVERELKRRGVVIWYAGYKTHNDLQMPRLLDAWGFQSADTYRAKWIGT